MDDLKLQNHSKLLSHQSAHSFICNGLSDSRSMLLEKTLVLFCRLALIFVPVCYSHDGILKRENSSFLQCLLQNHLLLICLMCRIISPICGSKLFQDFYVSWEICQYFFILFSSPIVACHALLFYARTGCTITSSLFTKFICCLLFLCAEYGCGMDLLKECPPPLHLSHTHSYCHTHPHSHTGITCSQENYCMSVYV